MRPALLCSALLYSLYSQRNCNKTNPKGKPFNPNPNSQTSHIYIFSVFLLNVNDNK